MGTCLYSFTICLVFMISLFLLHVTLTNYVIKESVPSIVFIVIKCSYLGGDFSRNKIRHFTMTTKSRQF